MHWLNWRLRPLFSQLRLRLRAIFRTAEMERELENEMRFHIEMETEKHVREGLDPQEARRRAMIAFGGVERHKEGARDARGVRWFQDMAKDVRYAVRRLLRDRGYSVPTVTTLALGIGVTVAVFALVYAVLVRPLPYPEPDRLVAVGHTASGIDLGGDGLSPGTFQYYRKSAASDDGSGSIFEELGLYYVRTETLADPGAPERVRIAFLTPGVFTILRATPHLGRLPVEWEGTGTPRQVLISYNLWMRRYGGNPAILGRKVKIRRIPGVIVGVAERGFHFPEAGTDVWTGGMHWLPRPATSASIQYGYLNGIARLAPGVAAATAERELQRFMRALPGVYPDITAEQIEAIGLHAEVVPFKDTVVGEVRAVLLLLLGAAAFLLLITWANVTNLTLVRAGRCRREVAVERALGGTGWHLGRRFFAESLVVALVGGGLGLGLAYAAVELRFGFQPVQIPRLGQVGLHSTALTLTIALVLASALLIAGASFVSARGPNLMAALTGASGRTTASRREQMGRRGLVAGQVALALTLLICSALMARSFWRLQRVELGFEPEGALTFYLPLAPGASVSPLFYRDMAGKHAEILPGIRALPGVEAVEAASIAVFPLRSAAAYVPTRFAAANTSQSEDDDAPYALHGFATPGYFRMMGIPLLRGRGFRPEDTALESPGVVISRSMARALFGQANPMGRSVRWVRTSSYPDYTVVGVVGDVPGTALREGASRAVYFPHIYPPLADTVTFVLHNAIPQAQMYVVRTELPPLTLMPAIRQVVQEVDPTAVPTRVATLEQLVSDSVARARLTMLLLLIGATTALFLGIVGIYGVLAYMVRARTPELGVRLALGATPGAVTRMIVREGAALALAGIAVGTAAAFALTRFLETLLYEVSPTDPAVFIAMAALLFSIALAGSFLPARRAARIDPVRSLKSE